MSKVSDEPTYTVLTFTGRLPAEYEGLLYANWLRSFRNGNDMIKLINSSAYYDNYKNVITALCSHPKTQIRVAALSDEPDVAFGFSVCSPGILHYVYVPHAYRRTGIGRELIPPPMRIHSFTHVTKSWLAIWPTKNYQHMKYNPFSRGSNGTDPS